MFPPVLPPLTGARVKEDKVGVILQDPPVIVASDKVLTTQPVLTFQL